MANISKAGFFYLVFEFVNQAFVGLFDNLFLKDVCDSSLRYLIHNDTIISMARVESLHCTKFDGRDTYCVQVT